MGKKNTRVVKRQHHALSLVKSNSTLTSLLVSHIRPFSQNHSDKYPAIERKDVTHKKKAHYKTARVGVTTNTLQSSIRMIIKATRYMRNDDIRKAIKINSFKSRIQKIAKNFFNSLQYINNVNMLNLLNYNPNDTTKRQRRILLDSYNPP
ncbi:uncharacterized protein TNCV_3724271 [Trichonephila clavipes]|nr:uncharacterized protein TNCV_3724271 [Trichonephila clavipes]